jgi:hypothetical protein
MILPIMLAVAATVGALLYVVRPLFGRAELPAESVDGIAAGRLELVEERDRALAALKELEFDHRTGKISDVDYRELVGPLRRRAVETLRALESMMPPVRSASSRRRRRPGMRGRKAKVLH